MKTLLIGALLICGVAGATPPRAQVPGLEPKTPYSLGGYVKYLAQVGIPQTGPDTIDHLVTQRFNFEYRWHHSLAFAVGMRNRLFLGDSLEIPGANELIEFDPGHWDLSWNWLEADNAVANTNLDRLYLDWQRRDWQVRFGRQRINWGMTTLWNPNDLFNTYNMFDFDYEERPGTDALLAGRTLDFASAIDGVWAFGDNWDQTSLAGRYLFNTAGYDIQLVGGKNRIDLVVGGGFSGSIRGAGLRGELNYFSPYRDEWQNREWNRATVAALETDYAVSGPRNLTCTTSVLYTSNPEDPGTILVYLNRPLTARTLSFARWTGYGTLGFDLTALSRQTAGGATYSDGSWFATADNTVSLADDWDLLLVWQHFDGTDDSLFGENPLDFLFGRIRWNF